MANKYPTVTTPRGVLVYPHITKPDTKFVKPDGEYHTKFALVAGKYTTDAFIAQLQEVLDAHIEENPEGLKPAALKKTTRAEFAEEELDEEGEETGRVVFKFKLKAKVKTETKEWEQAPRLFDGKAEPINGDIHPWTGTEAKVSLELFPYFMQSTKTFGLSLRMKAVQILSLVEGSGKSGDSYGFGEEEGGFVDESTGRASGFGDESSDDDDGDEEF